MSYTMDVLNKFKSTLQSSVSSTVFTTVSSIKDVLPGNPVTREYEVHEHIATAGPGSFFWHFVLGNCFFFITYGHLSNFHIDFWVQ